MIPQCIKYEDEGIFNFIYSIPNIIYSLIISSIINILISKLSLSDENIIELKKESDINKLQMIKPKIIKKIKIKFFLFYSFNCIFLILFWYYISCFCAVYKNTQIYLLKNTLISFGISFLYPFILSLFPAIIRIKSLREPGEFLFKLSKFYQ